MTGNPLNVLSEVSAKFTFKRRPISLPGDLRPDWRIAVLVLTLRKCSHGGQSTLRRLHVLNWAIRSATSREAFIRRLDGQNLPDEVLVRYDPALNRAIDLARGLGLVDRVTGNRVKITQPGIRLADDIDATPNILAEERTFLSNLRGRATEAIVDKLVRGEG